MDRVPKDRPTGAQERPMGAYELTRAWPNSLIFLRISQIIDLRNMKNQKGVVFPDPAAICQVVTHFKLLWPARHV